MGTVSGIEVVSVEEAQEVALPAKVQEALGELVQSAKEGLLALSVGVGLGVLAELLEEEVDEVVGPKGKHNPDRVAIRHGHEHGEVTLGGRRVGVERPRVRSHDGEREVELNTYRHFADRDPLSRLVLEQMLAGVSTRRFERTREPVGEEIEANARARSKSATSRDFIAKTTENLLGLMSRSLADIRLAALMLDGIELKGRCCVVALGIGTDGVKVPLGLWDGSTENTTVAKELFTNLVARGLDLSQGVLCVIDGAKALRKAIEQVLGPVPVQRCIRHKERNVLEHLAERDRPPIKARLRRAWADEDHERAVAQLQALAQELERSHPGAAASATGGAPGDTHDHAPGREGAAEAHAAEHQPLRVDDRDRQAHESQRQALAVGRDVPALDRRRHARGRAPVPSHHRPRRSRQTRARRRARTPNSHHAGGRRHPHLREFTLGPPPNSTGERDILRRSRQAGRARLAAAPV